LFIIAQHGMVSAALAVNCYKQYLFISGMGQYGEYQHAIISKT